MELTIEKALQRAVAAHKRGRLNEAEQIYRSILQGQPKHPDANHNLGVIAVSMNQLEAALPLFKNALDINPNVEQFWVSYVDALFKSKRLADAKLAIKKAKKKGFDARKLQALRSHSKSAGKTKGVSQPQLNDLLEHYRNQEYAKAESLAVSITEAFPKHQVAWKILGAVYRATGRTSEAAKTSQIAVTLDPNDAEAHSNLGVILQELGALDEALASYKQAIALKPDYAQAHNNLGVTLGELGRLDDAKTNFKRAITIKPDYSEAYTNLGNTLQQQGKLEEALTNHNLAIALKPNYADAYCNLGNTLAEQGNLNKAAASYKQAIALRPDFAEAYSNLGNALKELGILDEALASYNQAIALKPNYAEPHYNLGIALKELGRIKEALVSHNQAIALKPNYAEAHRHLTVIKKFDRQDEQYSKMKALHSDTSISEHQRCHINFGLAKACEDLGDFENAFAHYREGNMLRKKLLNYDISEDEELFSKIKSNYPAIEQTALESKKFSKNLTPVFIVGMPRSGTTLIEQIISSHSQVTGAGELAFAAQLGTNIATGFTQANEESLLDFRHNYLRKLHSVSNGNLIVTDKMPQNFRFIGLLAAAFPEAKIVHVKRIPAAVCWANYTTYFASASLGFAYALDDIVKYYRLYEDLTEFWSNEPNFKIHDLDYELITVKQEEVTRKLIDFLDLDWEERCLSPQKNTRSVTTASNLQVRKKVYRGSSEQWKKYRPFLGDVFDHLSSNA